MHDIRRGSVASAPKTSAPRIARLVRTSACPPEGFGAGSVPERQTSGNGGRSGLQVQPPEFWVWIRNTGDSRNPTKSRGQSRGRDDSLDIAGRIYDRLA